MTSEDLPEKIGKYTILDVAGRGSMGVVYVGHDPFADEKVAIKVCSLDEEDERQARLKHKLFFNEAKAAGSLDHPGVLSVLDAGEEPGFAYIVMEFIEGARTLRDHVEPDKLLPVIAAVEAIYQCAKALDYAHRRGVVHRDIKPSNIALSADGKTKLVDFGIAQLVSGDDTQVMGVLGSPRYMSPEQVREDDLNHQTDLFSLGVVFYELLTGQSPFKASGISELVRKILYQDPDPLTTVRPEIPESLSNIVLKMLAKDLDRRYETGGELAADLASIYVEIKERPQGITTEQKIARAKDLRFFNDFSHDELKQIVEVCQWATHSAGEQIIGEGSLEHCFYVLVTGSVKVVKGGTTISSLDRGDCFGEMGYLAKVERTASIVAVDDVELLRIDSATMERTPTTTQLRFTQAFLATLINRLARTSTELSRQGS